MKTIAAIVILVLPSPGLFAYEFKANKVVAEWSLHKYTSTVHHYVDHLLPDHQVESYSFLNYSDAGGAYELEPPQYVFRPFANNPILLDPAGKWGNGFLEIKLGDKYKMGYDFTSLITSGSTAERGKAAETGDVKYRVVPDIPGIQSVYRFACAHPETITSHNDTSRIEWGYIMDLEANKKGSANAGLSLSVRCTVRYERQYHLNLSILNTTMDISSKSGTVQS